MKNNIITLYKDDEIMIINSSITGDYYYYKYNNRNVKIELGELGLTKEEAEKLAPLLKGITKRLISYAYTEGYTNGLKDGTEYIKEQFKILLDINKQELRLKKLEEQLEEVKKTS